MHCDKKIGLALGILLIGVVAAFFFRNERSADDVIPELEDPQALDREIIAKNGPYPPPAPAPRLTGRIEDEAASRPAQPWSPLSEQELSSSIWSTASDETKTKESGSPQAPSPGPLGSPGPPDPIRPIHSADGGIAIVPVPDHNAAWQAGPGAASQLPRVPAETEPASRLYQVQQGDTLSDLAQRFLGSSARYAEIFEANRNILRNPNDLQVGMRIRIPRRQETALPTVPVRPISRSRRMTAGDETAVRESSRGDTSPRAGTPETNSVPADTGKAKGTDPPPRPSQPRFIPARRSPFTPRPYNVRPSSEEDAAANPRRKLSQLPPGEPP